MRYSTPYRGTAGYRSREDDEGHDGGYSVPVDNGRTMVAKFAGKCRETGAAIRPGDTIRYIKGYGSVLVSSATPAPAAGRYVSDVIRTSGGTFYRNKAGRCEDAPCCGCCNI